MFFSNRYANCNKTLNDYETVNSQ